jgi:hypothetical protein
MKTKLVRNELTLSQLELKKTNLDRDVEVALLKLLSEFENTTQVAVKSIFISWNNSINVSLKDCIDIKLDLF